MIIKDEEKALKAQQLAYKDQVSILCDYLLTYKLPLSI